MLRFLKTKFKPKAIAFVDYDYWFYSSVSRWGIRPNVSEWKKELDDNYAVVKTVFFADFSVERMREEQDYIASISDELVDIQSIRVRKSKDVTDFLMLDRLYQSAHTDKNIRNYILFTGDSLFQPAVSFLTKDLGKNVIGYGIKGSYSSSLRDAVTESFEIPPR